MATVDQDLIPLGEAVRRLRKARGLTQEDLSGLTELHQNHIGGIERGERNITIKTVLALARALETEPMELLAGYALQTNVAEVELSRDQSREA